MVLDILYIGAACLAFFFSAHCYLSAEVTVGFTYNMFSVYHTHCKQSIKNRWQKKNAAVTERIL